ncbi:MAG: DMT family transporter [Pseudomonadota bacterium]
MTSIRRSRLHPNIMGSLWMIASMTAFSFEDVFLKLASSTMPVSLVMVTFGMLGIVCFAGLCAVRRQSVCAPDLTHPSMVLRFWFEVFGRLFFTLSLILTTLSSTVAILQATPLVVVAGAALFFGERVSVSRWLAICAGLGGVMLILRPSASEFSMLSTFAVLGMLGLALRDLATRATPRSIPNAVLGFYSFASVVAAGAVYAVWDDGIQHWPGPADWPLVAGASLSGVIGYIALTEAMRTGEVSAVTPFRYTRLVCGVFFGVALFGETLDLFDALGSVLVVGSGLFILVLRKPLPAPGNL